MREFEGTSATGLKLAGRFWPGVEPTATVVGIHGYSEYSGRYNHVGDYLATQGFDVYWIDLPGHGKSAGQRGDIDRFSDYVEACEFVVDRACSAAGVVRPIHLFGHSLGGLVCLRFLQTSSAAKEITSLLVSGPLLGLNRFSELTLKLLEWMTLLLPNFRLSNNRELGEGSLTHDLEMQRSRRADPLVNHLVTFHWFREFVRARRLAFEQVSRLKVPFKMLIADEEIVVSASEALRFFELIDTPHKSLKRYPKMCHELVNEVGRSEVLADMAEWFKTQSLTRAFVSK